MDNLDLNKLKLKGGSKCDCGFEFTVNNITKLIKNDDVHYYGGRVKFYSKTTCPKCNKDIVLMLENYNNSFRVIDIAIMSIAENNKVTSKVEEKNSLMCENCGRTFKSPAGLISHQKKCLGNN